MSPFRALVVALLAVLSAGFVAANAKNESWVGGLVGMVIAVLFAFAAIVVATR